MIAINGLERDSEKERPIKKNNPVELNSLHDYLYTVTIDNVTILMGKEKLYNDKK